MNSLMERVNSGGEGTIDPSEEAAKRKRQIFDRLTKNHGLDRQAAIAILANIDIETEGTFDPTTIQKVGKKRTPTGPGFGLVQWENSRRADLHKWATNNKRSPTDLDTQVDYIIHEFNTTEKAAKQHLDEAVTLEDKIRSFLDKFERASKPHTDRRIKSGQELDKSLMDTINNNSPTPEATPPPEFDTDTDDIQLNKKMMRNMSLRGK